jgi:SAM-dependent methyltransferase
MPFAERSSFVPDCAEVEILLRCARTRVPNDGRSRIEELLAGGVDWTLLAQLAISHAVTPLLHRTLRELGSEAVPAELLEALEVHSGENERRSLALVEELLAILDGLERRGVAAVPFKGPALAEVAHGDVSLRQSGDIDLLVREEDIAETCAELERRGYLEEHEYESGRPLSAAQHACIRRYQCEYLFIRRRDGLMVEPHWAIAPRTFAVELDYPALWSRLAPLDLGGRLVTSFSLEDLLLVLCIHASKHQWTELRWISDVAELIGAHPELDWPAVLGRAREQGCARMLAVGLELARELLGAELPELARSCVEGERHARALARLSAQRLFAPQGRRPSVFRLSRYQVRLRERRRDKLAYALRTAFTPRLEHMRILPLPEPLHFFYYPLKLGTDTLVLPVWNRVKHRLRDAEPTPAAPGPREWSARTPAWLEWVDAPAGWSEALSEALLQAAEIAPEQRVLDLACGVGEPALRVARTPPGAVVVGVDWAPAMLDAARRRAGAKRLSVCAGRLESLPFRDGSFDRVVCRFGIEYAQPPAVALAEVLRVLRPGGRAAVMVWGSRAENTAFEVIHRTASRFFAGEARPDARPLSLARRGRLARELRRVGFARVAERAVRHRERGTLSSVAWEPQLEIAYGSVVSQLPELARKAFEEELEAAFARSSDAADGALTTARLAVGQRP